MYDMGLPLWHPRRRRPGLNRRFSVGDATDCHYPTPSNAGPGAWPFNTVLPWLRIQETVDSCVVLSAGLGPAISASAGLRSIH